MRLTSRCIALCFFFGEGVFRFVYMLHTAKQDSISSSPVEKKREREEEGEGQEEVQGAGGGGRGRRMQICNFFFCGPKFLFQLISSVRIVLVKNKTCELVSESVTDLHL